MYDILTLSMVPIKSRGTGSCVDGSHEAVGIQVKGMLESS